LTKFQELTNEQLLFTNLAKALVTSPKSPSVVHSQCQTKQDPEDVPNVLPSVKFDLMVNVKGHDDDFTVIVQWEGINLG
jgi:hypothetical protein